MKKLKPFDLGKRHFKEDGTQNYLIFQPMDRYFKLIPNHKYISEWKSKWLSHESIKPPTTYDNSLSPLIDYLGNETRLKFNGSCFKQHKLTYTHRTIVNIYIAYEISISKSNNNYPTLENSSIVNFGGVKVTKNADIDKYGYSGYRIRFDRRETFSFPGGGFGCNVIIFRVDMSSSTTIDNRKKDI